MRPVRLLRLAVLPALVAVLAGCGSAAPTTTVTGTRAAGEQQADLGWVEAAGSPGSRLVFRVRRFSVTRSGWSADVSITNETTATFDISGRTDPSERAFGVMVFRSGAHAELDRRDADRTLPAIRSAVTIAPLLPATLRPQATWTGTLSAPGALPSGLWVRFVFGEFVPEDAVPQSLRAIGVRNSVVWITDHAHRLR